MSDQNIKKIKIKSSKPPVQHNPYLHDLVWGLLKDMPKGTLLDIPSGPGYFAKRAKEAGFDSVAGEIDESLYLFDGLKYVSADMSHKMPFEDATYDYIVSIEGIEHIENQFHFIRECYRILKPGGHLFLTTPNVSSLENRLCYLITGVHENPSGPIRDDQDNIYMSHINLIPFYRLETFIRFAGLTIDKLTTYRMRKGSRFIYPFIYLFSALRFKSIFGKYYRDKKDATKYHKIFKMYQSRAVLCGSHLVVVAKKEA